MREIEFRAWDTTLCKTLDVLTLEQLIKGDFNNTKLDQLIFMQYTGLKDKNGTKIFEGDIIVLSNDSVKGEIFFNEKISAFQLRYLGELGELFEPKFLGEWITCYSIVGNIHDNPELLQN